MREADFQSLVVGIAQMHGWSVAHFRPVQAVRRNGTTKWGTPVSADGAGFPDLVIAKGGRIKFRELKAEKGRLSPEQHRWGAQLGASWAVWRPSDLDLIKKELAA